MTRIIVFLFAVFFLIGCSEKEQQPISKTQWQILSYMPAETQVITYLNLAELKTTEHWKKFQGKSLLNRQVDNWLTEFEAKTGTGLTKGISEVFISFNPDGNNMLALVFNDDHKLVKNYFENEKKFSSAEIGGKTVYHLLNDSFKFYFANDSTLLIIQDEIYLENLIAGKNQSIKDNNSLATLIKDIKNGNHYWFVTDKGSYAAALIQKLVGMNKNFAGSKILGSIDNITLAAEFSDGVVIESVLGCKDEKNAYLLAVAIKSALSMDILSESDYTLGKILQNLDIERENKKVYLELNINEKDIRQLQDIAKRQPDKKL